MSEGEVRSSLTPERWRRLRSLLAELLEMPAEERMAHVARVSASEPELGAELESLLAASADEAGWLETPAAALELTSRDRLIGQRLGAYLVLEELGSGGMGEVFRAVRGDNEYRQEVAIKLLSGASSSQAAIVRFRQERQILAALNHPNIARLLDGGTTDHGVPYLVMERIEGQPLHEYCDSHRLTTAQRVELFLQVCLAVQYAHQHLIVHRDIKPSNILVTPDGVPKLLDFGIAKILDPSAAVSTSEGTLGTRHLFTPEYACPEQLLGQPITAASDVYSLGIVLYELLAGCSPYPLGADAPHELGRVICELEPDRPSSVVGRAQTGRRAVTSDTVTPEQIAARRSTSPAGLKRALSSDLDHIVLKALRKAPQQRYASVQSLYDDLRAYLSDRPVAARRGTLLYRAQRFATRHALALSVALLIGLMAVVGVAAILRATAIARAERLLAERRFDSLRTLTDSLLFEFHDSIENLPGSTAARELVVRRALDYLNQLAAGSAGSAGSAGNVAVERDLAAAYERIARIEGEDLRAHLGGAGAAEKSRQLYDKALAIRRQLVAEHPDDEALQLELLATVISVSAIYDRLGDTPQALQLLQDGLRIAQRLASRHDSTELRYRMGGLLTSIAALEVWLGDLPAALSDGQRGLAIKQALLAASPQSARAKRQVLLAIDWIGTAMKFQRRYREAAAHYEEALRLADALAAQDPNNIDLQRLVAGENESLCKTLAYAGAFDQVPLHCQNAIAASEAMANADPNNVQALADIGSANLAATIAYYLMGMPLRALSFARHSDEVYRRVEAKEPDSLGNSVDHGVDLLYEARIEARLGDAAAARSLLSHALVLTRWTVEHSRHGRYYRECYEEAEALEQTLPRDTAPLAVH